jgi:hypothetical protein
MLEPHAGLIRSTEPPAAWRKPPVADFVINGLMGMIAIGLLAALLVLVGSWFLQSGVMRCDAPPASDVFEVCVDGNGRFTS